MKVSREPHARRLVTTLDACSLVQHEASEDLTYEAAPRPNPIINQADNRTAK